MSNTFESDDNHYLIDHCYDASDVSNSQPSTDIDDFDLLSSDFDDQSYSILACPQHTTACGSKFVDLTTGYTNPLVAEYGDDTEVTRDQDWGDELMSSCGYIVRADCGVPYVKIEDDGGVSTSSTFDIHVFEFAMDSTYLIALDNR